MSVRRAAAIALATMCLAGTGHARSKTKRIPNMPRGWSWPPNAAMVQAGATCLEDLAEREVQVESGEGKKVNSPVRVPSMRIGGVALEPTWRKGPFVLDCHLVRALHDAAPELRALGVQALRFSTIHEHRYVKRNGRRTNILSRHAIGLAMDVFEVRMDDGRILVVKKHYADDPALPAVERVFAQRDDFRTPLSPGNDPKGHDDHLHLEARMPLRRSSRSGD